MQTLGDMVLHRLGLVRRKHYDGLIAQHIRLADKYTALRNKRDKDENVS